MKLGESHIKLINVYIPPQSGCDSDYTTAINQLLNFEAALILRDVYAHNHFWFSELEKDARWTTPAKEKDDSDHVVINENCEISPNIGLANANLAMNTNWTTESCLGSDYQTTMLTPTCNVDFVEQTKKVFINNRKADWKIFHDSTELVFGKCSSPQTVPEGKALFRKTFIKAVKWRIPQDRIKEFRPHFPKQAAEISKTRDDFRSINLGDPNISQLNNETDVIVNRHKRDKWMEFVITPLTHNGESHNLWETVNSWADKSTDITQNKLQ